MADDGQRERDRKRRLAGELRANLARRKAQVRARRAGEEDRRAEGLGGADVGVPEAERGEEGRESEG